MHIQVTKPDGTVVHVDSSSAVLISLPIRRLPEQNPNAYGLPKPMIEPVADGDFIGSIAKGAPVNCELITLSPHGNGTHTECVGHIADGSYWIADAGLPWMGFALLLTLQPKLIAEDYIISADELNTSLRSVNNSGCEAVILRTLPNGDWKKTHSWTGTNPPYMDAECAALLRKAGFRHLLLDVPSVDREKDGGVLAAHHAFWNYPTAPQTTATITEMVYVPDTIADGVYLASITTLALESDASPSVVVLYPIQ